VGGGATGLLSPALTLHITYREGVLIDGTAACGHDVGGVEGGEHGTGLTGINNKHQLVVPAMGA